MTDFRRFLGGPVEVVLPWLGGATVDGPGRRLRVSGAEALGVAPGWRTFRVSGRDATPGVLVEPPELTERPKVAGHLTGDWLFLSGRELERLWLLPEAELPNLSRCLGRRWHGGAVLFAEALYDDNPEAAARSALEEGRSLAGIKGISPSLRAAFGYALSLLVGRRLSILASPRELQSQLSDIAEGGPATAELALRALAAARLLARRNHWASGSLEQILAQARIEGARQRQDTLRAEERIRAALDLEGAALLGTRCLEAGRLEVTYRLLGERFVSVVDSASLQVIDAGICLQGADAHLTLDSLPSVIREAIEEGMLHITRW